MSNGFFSMALMNMAVEIKPAQTVQRPKAAESTAASPREEPETFGKVLNRIENRNQDNSAEEVTRTAGNAESMGAVEVASRGNGKQMEKEVSGKSGEENSAAVNAESKPQTDNGKPETQSPGAATSASTTPDAECGISGSTQSTPVQTDGQASISISAQIQEFVMSEIVSVSNNQVAEIPAQTLSQNQAPTQMLPQIPIQNHAVSVADIPIVNIEVPAINIAQEPSVDSVIGNTVTRPVDQPAIALKPSGVESAPVINVDSNTRETFPGKFVELSARVFEPINHPQIQVQPENLQPLFKVTEPASTVVRNAVIPQNSGMKESEWSEVLQIDRLLNPTMKRETVTINRVIERQATDLPTEQQAYPKPQDSVRIPTVSRFTEILRNGEPQAKDFDPKILINNAKPEIAPQPVMKEPVLLQIESIRPITQSNAVIPAAGSVLEASGEAGLGRQPISAGTVTSQFRINAQALVSDVREAVMKIASDGRGEMKLVLNPPELGELVVRLESAKNGIVRLEFHTISPLVRQALEAGLSKLADALKSEGLTLANAEVHLNLQPGHGGDSGEAEFGNSDEGMSSGIFGEGLSLDASGDTALSSEWLPEGSTISILA